MKGFRVDGTGESPWPWQRLENSNKGWNENFAPPRRHNLLDWMFTGNQRAAAEAEQRRTGVYPEDAPPRTLNVGDIGKERTALPPERAGQAPLTPTGMPMGEPGRQRAFTRQRWSLAHRRYGVASSTMTRKGSV